MSGLGLSAGGNALLALAGACLAVLAADKVVEANQNHRPIGGWVALFVAACTGTYYATSDDRSPSPPRDPRVS